MEIEPQQSGPTRPTETPPASILVVDDMATNREIVKAALSAGSFTVDEAASGEQALERVASGNHDLVLLDIAMTGVDMYVPARHLL